MRFDKKLLILIVILMVSCGMEVFACHGENLGAAAKGHYKWSKNLGYTFRASENVTIGIFTTSSCDFYAQFISHEYNYITEAAARGQGEHLLVLAEWVGCPLASRSKFSTTMQARYASLFAETSREQPDEFLKKLKEMVALTPTLKQACQA